MKTIISKSLFIAVAVSLIVLLILFGCDQHGLPIEITSTPHSSLPMATSPTSPTVATSQTVTATVLPSTILVADAPPNGCYLELSPNIEWMTNYCTPAKMLKVGKVGEEAQMMTLFEEGVRNFFFSPDSQKLLVLARDPVAPHDSFWLYNVGNWQSPKKLLSVSSGGAATWYKATWSPDSEVIALNYFEEGYALSILYLDGTVKNLLTSDDVRSPAVGYMRGGFGPTWSPDSKKVAYVSDKMFETQPVQIHTVDVATGEKELLYSGKPGESGFNPVWSPDGNMIALGTFSEESHPIYIYNIKEKTFTAFGDFYFHYTAAWSPDSKYLAVCNHIKGAYVISVLTGQIINLNVSPCPIVYGWKGNDNIVVSLQGQAIYLIPFQRQ
jgi:WD40 repeat protein